VPTVNGRIRLGRRRRHSAGEGTTAPTDALLDLAEAAIGPGVRELACRLNGAASDFDKTAANPARAARVHAGGETPRRPIEAEGRSAPAARRNGGPMPDRSAADCRTAEGPTRVYLGSDGVMVPLITDAEKKARRREVRQKRRRRGRKARPPPPARAGADRGYKGFEIVAYYDETRTHCRAVATRHDHEAAGRPMRREAARIDLTAADEKIANVDGAEGIRNRIRRQSPPPDAVGLDFFPLAEHVHEARRAVFGEEAPAGHAWSGEAPHAAGREGYAALWDRLTAWRAGLRGGRRKAADRLPHYVARREEMIRYPEFRARGWQIGGGPTEALCKTTTARLKGSGTRWDGDNAEAVRALACLERSGQWQVYWRTRLRPTG
jgi:hypothetical protein